MAIRSNYRIYEYSSNKMIYEHDNKFHFGTWNKVFKLNPSIKDDNWFEMKNANPMATMQNTGLVDNMCQELYEGDLFVDTKRKEGIIYRVWKVVGGFAINTHVKMWQKDILCDYPHPLIPLADERTVSWFESSCRIIGNIYQNDDYKKLVKNI
jgi:hypothetical protein